MTNFSKKSYIRAILGPFCTNFAENELALSVFKYLNYLPLSQKAEKTNERFLRKILNCWTDRQQ